LVALLGVLALAILIALQPWAPASVAPQLGLAPGIGVGLGDAIPVASEPALAVAPAQRARDGGSELVAASASAAGSGSQLASGLAPAQAVAHSAPAAPTEAAPEAPQPPEPQPVAEPEQSSPPPESTPVPVSAPAEPSPQPVAAAPTGLVALGSAPQTAGAGELGGVEGETPEGEEVAEEEGEGEDECTPPFSLVLEGIRHEVAICFEASEGEVGLYLLLDGELIDIDTWGNQPAPGEAEGAEPALP
jgi:hypothetical protein